MKENKVVEAFKTLLSWAVPIVCSIILIWRFK
jgi:hypothetical protein